MIATFSLCRERVESSRKISKALLSSGKLIDRFEVFSEKSEVKLIKITNLKLSEKPKRIYIGNFSFLVKE